MDSQKLKSLNVQKSDLINIIEDYENQQISMNRIIKNNRSSLHSINKQIKDLTNSSKSIVISEHALLRYLERVGLMDMEEIKKRIIPDEQMLNIKGLVSNCTYPIDGYKLVIKNNVVVTIKT